MYDIVFISYDEHAAFSNFIRLTSMNLRNKIVKVHGVKGIHQAHKESAKLVTTEMFYVVDADAQLLPNFRFNLKLDESEEDIVHVWRSRNPINDLEYGYGGVKLLPTSLTLSMDLSKPDMTTSISKRFKVMPDVSNITKFNTDPMSTWRSAFRECAKLSSRSINGQDDAETQHRLDTWCTVGRDREFGVYAITGAREGRKFGSLNKSNQDNLLKINDYEWLEDEYKKYVVANPPRYFRF